MCNSKNEENKNGGLNERNQTSNNEQSICSGDSSREIENSVNGIGSNGSDVGLTERLRNILSDEGDGDLLLQANDGGNNVLQWLQALDLQVIGACRADERLKPLLKLNVSSGLAEDHLLAHLSQHFEVPEVGKLARCLCIPLVSIRIGRVMRQGSLLCPTGTRVFGTWPMAMVSTNRKCYFHLIIIRYFSLLYFQQVLLWAVLWSGSLTGNSSMGISIAYCLVTMGLSRDGAAAVTARLLTAVRLATNTRNRQVVHAAL